MRNNSARLKIGLALAVGLMVALAVCTRSPTGPATQELTPSAGFGTSVDSTPTLTPVPSRTPPPLVPAVAPTPATETPTPVAPAESAAVSTLPSTPAARTGDRDLDRVIDMLGYVLVPGYVPAGFETPNVSVSGGRALVTYESSDRRFLVAYPVPFYPEGNPLMVELGLITPDDALSEVSVEGAPAYVMRGEWSADTIIQGPGIDPNFATWDYPISVTLFFEYTLAGGNGVGVAIKAFSEPSAWITTAEMVKIAESLGSPE